MKITLAQLNPVIGDIDGNLAKALDALSLSCRDQSDLIVFPELFLVGYPPRDLLERPRFIERAQEAVDKLKQVSKNYPGMGIIVGSPLPTGKDTGPGLYNSALFIFQGELLFSQHKSLLPTYDVFDEARYFDSASDIHTVAFKDEVLGISVCEDAWNDPQLWQPRNYAFDPIEQLARKGASIVINIAASPFYVGKEEMRLRIMGSHARKYRIPFVVVNQVGGNDELIFDGRSICIDREGEPIEIFPSFRENVKTVDMSLPGNPERYVPRENIENICEALILGVRDYIKKCGFSKAVIGLSGGIDSAVTCCLAKEAIGAENVLGVSMPGPYSSQGSVTDSRKLAENLAISFKVIPISQIYTSFHETLKAHFQGKEPDITEENLQARIRGNILMGLSNKFGYLVLSTGNKSELSVGYCTIYGDMVGGLAVISDVPKTSVYQLAHYINRKIEVIPLEIIQKPPSAELRPDQKDQDTLPPYEVLDQILHYYVDEGSSLKDIINMSFDPEIVKWVIRMVDRNEYKRRQAAPGLKVTSKAFGMGRRMMIAAISG